MAYNGLSSNCIGSVFFVFLVQLAAKVKIKVNGV